MPDLNSFTQAFVDLPTAAQYAAIVAALMAVVQGGVQFYIAIDKWWRGKSK